MYDYDEIYQCSKELLSNPNMLHKYFLLLQHASKFMITDKSNERHSRTLTKYKFDDNVINLWAYPGYGKMFPKPEDILIWSCI